MIKRERLLILSSTTIALDTVEMILKNTYISQTAVPGQFLHISVAEHMLRRPISIANIDREAETITIVFKVIGTGTAQLANCLPGMEIDALGPNGNGFQTKQDEESTVLLIGGGVGVPPLHYLGRVLAQKNTKVISVLGFQTAQAVFYEEEFKQFSTTYIMTNDGTAGEKGFVTDVLDNVGDFNCYYTCGPLPMLQAVTKKLSHKEGYISLEERMGCGVGACFACVIPTDDHGGYQKICQDGPVFAAKEVQL